MTAPPPCQQTLSTFSRILTPYVALSYGGQRLVHRFHLRGLTVKERDIFLEAIEKGSPDERRSFLNLTCGDDTQLRNRVERLLKSHEDADNLLDHPILGDGPTEAITGPTDRSEPERSEDERITLDFLDASDEPGSLGRLGQYEVRKVSAVAGWESCSRPTIPS